MIYGNEGCGLETTTRVPVSHVLNETKAHYMFYCDFVGASELGPAALAVSS